MENKNIYIFCAKTHCMDKYICNCISQHKIKIIYRKRKCLMLLCIKNYKKIGLRFYKISSNVYFAFNNNHFLPCILKKHFTILHHIFILNNIFSQSKCTVYTVYSKTFFISINSWMWFLKNLIRYLFLVLTTLNHYIYI